MNVMGMIGHKKILGFFEKAAAENNLSHAYCFVGCNQIGKRKMARLLAARLLKTDEEKLELNPDFFYLTREEHETTGKMRKDIAVSQARHLKSRLSVKSWLGGYKVAIIDEAETLNDESGNALLKTLEDSNEKTVLFLLTVDDNALLPTIRSRCQIFYFSLVPQKEMVDGLYGMGFDKKIVEEISEFSCGRPGLAINLASDESLREYFKQEFARWTKISTKPFFKKIAAFEDLLGDKTDGVKTRDKIQESIDIWIMYWRRAMLEKPVSRAVKEIARLIDGLQETKKLVSMNVNSKLLLEQLFLKYSV